MTGLRAVVHAVGAGTPISTRAWPYSFSLDLPMCENESWAVEILEIATREGIVEARLDTIL